MAGSEQHSDPVVIAIERVLEAERAAEAKLQECRQQARDIVAVARDRAATIAHRADDRIATLHTAYLRKIGDDIAKLPHAPQFLASALDPAALTEAARRLAAKLTGDP
jgi:regulator of protease activity HflC (stomatin/prohibitin superfamily)